MSITKSSRLGVIACPGAENFTHRIVESLKEQYKTKYGTLSRNIGKRYGISVEEVFRLMNLTEDLHTLDPDIEKPLNEYRPPAFSVPVLFTRFANGELKAEILNSVKGMSLFIVQDVENHYAVNFSGGGESCSMSVNDHLLMLMNTVNAAHEAGAEQVTLVLPTYPYSRQHKKRGREALTAGMIGRMMEYIGVNRIITLDVHCKEIENSFNRLILENLHASYQILLKLQELIPLDDPDLVVIAPDTGSVDRNKFFADSLTIPLGLLYKERDYSKMSKNAGASNITNVRLLGDVKGKTVLVADDMLGTGGTLIGAIKMLKNFGAEKIICAISLPFFTGDAITHFDAAFQEGLFHRIIGTNGVYHDDTLMSRPWYLSADVTNLFARTISRLHHGRSLSPLLDNREIIQDLLRRESSEGTGEG